MMKTSLLFRITILLPVLLLLNGCVIIFTPRQQKVKFRYEAKDANVSFNDQYTGNRKKYLKFPVNNKRETQLYMAVYKRPGFKDKSVPVTKRRPNILYILDVHPLFLLCDLFFVAETGLNVLYKKRVKINEQELIPIPEYKTATRRITFVHVELRRSSENLKVYNKLVKYDIKAPYYNGSLLKFSSDPYLYRSLYQMRGYKKEVPEKVMDRLRSYSLYEEREKFIQIPYNQCRLTVKVDSLQYHFISAKKLYRYSPSENLNRTRVVARYTLTDYTGNTILDTTLRGLSDFYPASQAVCVTDAIDNATLLFLNIPSVKKYFEDDAAWTTSGLYAKNQQPLEIQAGNTGDSLSQLKNRIVSVIIGKETGNGCVISPDGHILTAYSLLKGEKNITVEFEGGKKCMAAVIRENPVYDLALLKMDTTQIPYFTLARSNTEQPGEKIFTISTPKNMLLKNTISGGIISSYRKYENIEFIQMDAAVNRGAVGGAIVNQKGELIGIVNFKVSRIGYNKLSFGITAGSIQEGLNLVKK